ncbi:MAG: SLBB domain-containing protein, partial [Lachnospiraceae bacterium]|nr:SLBB domain-containing protein [Lachnospiraceae bacterium]
MGENHIYGICEKQRGAGLFKVFLKGHAAVLLIVLILGMTTGCGMDRALTLEMTGEISEDGVGAGIHEGEDKSGEGTWQGGGLGGLGSGGAEDGTAVMIYVHVCGAVASPGLKALPEGSRAYDALELAGGFTEDADEEYVNL